jgi:hypothetical protein
MDRVLDLDRAARAIADLRRACADRPMRIGPTMWRDETDEFADNPFNQDRRLASDPFSVTVQFNGPEDDRAGGVALFRGGWADVWVLADGQIDAMSPEVPTIDAFVVLLNDLARRIALA